jgi:hypothetical protein
MKGVYLRCTFHVAIAATAAGWEVDVPDLLFLLPVVIIDDVPSDAPGHQ